MAWLLKKMSRAAEDIGGGAIIPIRSGRTTGRTHTHTHTHIYIYIYIYMYVYMQHELYKMKE